MKKSLLILQTEIEKELEDLEKLDQEMTVVLKRSASSFLETRAAGSILHDFYSGIEKIFRRITSRIDRDVPAGDDWHTDLLKRAAMPVDGLRPAVISEKLKEQLGEYLRFRHLFRNIYGFELKWERCRNLGLAMNSTRESFKREIKDFLGFVDSIEKS